MDTSTIRKLKELDNAFYEANHKSFSQTRSHAWDGWSRVLDSAGCNPATVLDVACGNMRFKAFLDERLRDDVCEYYGVDSCPSLLPLGHRGSFQQIDLIDELVAGTLSERLEAPACDLVASFGFMHHIPTFELRAAFMRALVEKTTPRGIVVVSFWQFALDEALRVKARESTSKALEILDVQLEDNDYLLGWQGEPGAYRYCHSFTDGEVAKILELCDDVLVEDRFKADGKSNRMNEYAVLRKR